MEKSIRIQKAFRIGQALSAFRRSTLTPLPEGKLRCVLTCTGAQDQLWRGLSREMKPKVPLEGCQSEPAHWESPGNVEDLLSRNFCNFTPRRTADFRGVSSTPGLATQPSSHPRAGNLHFQRSKSSHHTQAVLTQDKPPPELLLKFGSRSCQGHLS